MNSCIERVRQGRNAQNFLIVEDGTLRATTLSIRLGELGVQMRDAPGIRLEPRELLEDGDGPKGVPLVKEVTGIF